MVNLRIGVSDPNKRVHADQSDGTSSVIPFWFEYSILAAAAIVLAVGGAGLWMADNGIYSAGLSIPIGLLIAAGCVVLARPTRRRTPEPTARRLEGLLASIGVCVLAAVQAVWNFAYAGGHVAIDRDPGVYTVAARWLASHSSLVVPAYQTPNLSVGSQGVYVEPGGLQFEFAHLLPVLMAQAHSIGGNPWMVRVSAVVGAIALCTVFRVACLIVTRPSLALAAVVGLAVSLPELAFTRDSYSEPVEQLLIWPGVWLLIRAYREWNPGVGLVAGLFVGGSVMAHIDAFAFLVPLPALGALTWLADRPRVGARRVTNLVASVLLGVVPGAAIGTFDVQRRAGRYYQIDHHQIYALYLTLGVVTVVSLFVVMVAPLSRNTGRWFGRSRGSWAAGAGCVIVVGLALAWIVRPLGLKVAQVQLDTLVPPSEARTYAAGTMRWFQWYLGPVTLALGIGGIALLVMRAARTRFAEAVILLAITAPLTAYFLWNPSIDSPDQVWASRRFFAVGFPLFAVAAAYALDRIISLLAEREWGKRWRRPGMAVGAAAMVAFPLAGSLPVGDFQPQANYLPTVLRMCARLGPTADVDFTAGDQDAFYLEQTLRSFCNVPVAELRPQDSRTDVMQMAQRLRSEGKRLWLLAATRAALDPFVVATVPRVLGTAVSDHELARTLESPPEHYAAQKLTVYFLEPEA